MIILLWNGEPPPERPDPVKLFVTVVIVGFAVSVLLQLLRSA